MIVRFHPRPEDLQRLQVGPIGPHLPLRTESVQTGERHELAERLFHPRLWLAAGKPNKLIGADLTITEITVKSRVQSVFRKLNVLSRTEAIAVANRWGLLRL